MIRYGHTAGHESVHEKSFSDGLCLYRSGDNFILKLNNVSAFLWRSLRHPLSVDDLSKLVLNEYQVTKVQALKDVSDFVARFESYKLIEKEVA